MTLMNVQSNPLILTLCISYPKIHFRWSILFASLFQGYLILNFHNHHQSSTHHSPPTTHHPQPIVICVYIFTYLHLLTQVNIHIHPYLLWTVKSTFYRYTHLISSSHLLQIYIICFINLYSLIIYLIPLRLLQFLLLLVFIQTYLIIIPGKSRASLKEGSDH